MFVAVLSMSFGTLALLNAQALTWLGTFGGNRSQARDVSADGRVVVGWSFNASGLDHAFRWVEDQGREDLKRCCSLSAIVALVCLRI